MFRNEAVERDFERLCGKKGSVDLDKEDTDSEGKRAEVGVDILDLVVKGW